MCVLMPPVAGPSDFFHTEDVDPSHMDGSIVEVLAEARTEV